MIAQKGTPRRVKGLRHALREDERREAQKAWAMTLLWQLTAIASGAAGVTFTMPAWTELFPLTEKPKPSAGTIREHLLKRLQGK